MIRLPTALAARWSGLDRKWFAAPLYRPSEDGPLGALPPPQHFATALRQPNGLQAACAALGDTPQRDLVAALGAEAVLARADADRAPVPPPQYREGYHGADHLAWWLSGLGDALFVGQLCETYLPPAERWTLLDLGCSSGRFVRHAAADGRFAVHGCDLNATSVAWLRQHMGGGAVVFLNTVLPHLPLADASLDVLTAFSVFTHIDEFEEAWLLEIRRVLRPGGIAVVSVHPERTWADLRGSARFLGDHLLARGQQMAGRQLQLADLERPMPAERVVVVETTRAVNHVNVFHADAWLQRVWASILPIAERIPHAHGGHQDVLVLRKPR